MINNLIIVESPAKAKTIEKFLGKDYHVSSSMGHIRDLEKKDFGIDIKDNFKPRYIVPEDKKKIVSELKKLVGESKTVWLASDEDREGEAIAWHLSEVLKLDSSRTRRIVFHEITKEAILDAIKNYRTIDHNLVDAQQARRILDRIVGFEISPILWRKIKPSLSAGRVQSVAVRLIVEREREINDFVSTSSFKITGRFIVKDKNGKISELEAELSKKFATKKEALDFLNKCAKAKFTIKDISTKPSKKSPSPPFTTSTLQQEASRKLGYSVSQTMMIAQKLYESGKITYMRTDSVNLSQLALNSASKIITSEFGKDYLNIKAYKTKTKGAQEAHEAIRPTYLDKDTIQGNNSEKKLYELIWKRTIASQMSDAQLEKTSITIDISGSEERFIASGEVLKFDGFLKVYFESTDDEQEDEKQGLLPPLNIGELLQYKTIDAVERFTHYPPRYTEASLVRKLEELGIGRPSTYAPTISTIQNRGYVLKTDKAGKARDYTVLNLTNEKVTESKKSELYGSEKSKLFPDNIGMIVNDFLVEYFTEILDYNFTANVEKEFDEIASGNRNWTEMISGFYKKFHPTVESTLKKSEPNKGERILGKDPATGKPVIVKMGRYGAVAQIGENATDEKSEKPRFASLRKGQNLESITLEEALELFKLPRSLGMFEEAEMVVGIGKFGPYVRHKSAFYSLKKGVDDPYLIESDRAIELIREKREIEKNKVIKEYKEEPGLKVLNGRWGPYISFNKENYKIPKNVDPAALKLEDCMNIIKNSSDKKKPKKK
ncbi:MAG: type I DNA topoisomerase [Bacteroidales bacterium]|nr:type I DNA topoisomerase [Bacteroidales bacterium]